MFLKGLSALIIAGIIDIIILLTRNKNRNFNISTKYFKWELISDILIWLTWNEIQKGISSEN